MDSILKSILFWTANLQELEIIKTKMHVNIWNLLEETSYDSNVSQKNEIRNYFL